MCMIRDVKDALAKYGLNINLGKCSVHTNSGSTATHLVVDDIAAPSVAPSEGFKILGTVLTLSGRTSAEVTAQINAAWGKLHKLWPLIGRRDGHIRHVCHADNAMMLRISDPNASRETKDAHRAN